MLSIVIEIAFTTVAGAIGVSDEYVAVIDTLTLSVSAVGAVIGSLTALISAVGTAALYFELRQAKEGVSVTDLAAVFE